MFVCAKCSCFFVGFLFCLFVFFFFLGGGGGGRVGWGGVDDVFVVFLLPSIIRL